VELEAAGISTWGENRRGLALGLGLSVAVHVAAFLLLLYNFGSVPLSLVPDHYNVDLVEPDEAPPPPAPVVAPSASHLPGVPDRPEAADSAHMHTPGQGRPGVGGLPSASPSLPSSAPPAASTSETGVEGSAETSVAGRDTRALPDMAALLDRDVIREAARKDPEGGEGTGQDGVTFDTREGMYRGYMDMLKDKIEAIWVYPKYAADKKLYGDLYIRFVLKRDGTLGEIKLLRTSGHAILDEAAMRALKDGEPYWPLPESWKRDAIEINGHFVYSLGGYYIN